MIVMWTRQLRNYDHHRRDTSGSGVWLNQERRTRKESWWNKIERELGHDGERGKTYSAAENHAILSKDEDICSLFTRTRVEHVTEMIEQIMRHGNGGSILSRLRTNNADKEGTPTTVERYWRGRTKQVKVGHVNLPGIVSVFGGGLSFLLIFINGQLVNSGLGNVRYVN